MSGLFFHLPYMFKVHIHCKACQTEFAINYEIWMAFKTVQTKKKAG